MISVIIPTLNEAANLPELLAMLERQSEAREVIVADGGSDDATCSLARGIGAKVIRVARGRGTQIDAAARLARGDVLLFLHADSRFPAGGLAAIRNRLARRPELIGGNFRLLFDGGAAFSRWLEGFYGWIRARGVYYGDSGVFVRAEVYRQLGGIRPIALMEDYDFVRRMERAGPTCCIGDPPLVTSSRRFEGRQPVSIVWGWLKLHALFHLGVSPGRLARIYDSERKGRG